MKKWRFWMTKQMNFYFAQLESPLPWSKDIFTRISPKKVARSNRRFQICCKLGHILPWWSLAHIAIPQVTYLVFSYEFKLQDKDFKKAQMIRHDDVSGENWKCLKYIQNFQMLLFILNILLTPTLHMLCETMLFNAALKSDYQWAKDNKMQMVIKLHSVNWRSMPFCAYTDYTTVVSVDETTVDLISVGCWNRK